MDRFDKCGIKDAKKHGRQKMVSTEPRTLNPGPKNIEAGAMLTAGRIKMKIAIPVFHTKISPRFDSTQEFILLGGSS